MARSRLRLCIDRIIPADERKLAAAKRAIKENPDNEPQLLISGRLRTLPPSSPW